MDYFNETERAKHQDFAARRDQLFSPAIKALKAIGATPNQVSLVGTLFLLIACLMPPSMALVATLCMAAYVTCDGFDGPLARTTGQAHAGGSLVDIVSDQLGIVFLPAAACYHLGSSGAVMVLFSASYVGFITLVVYANSIHAPIRAFIRTKYFFFLFYLYCLYRGEDWYLTEFCIVNTVYYAVEIFIVVRRIYQHHAKENGAQ